MSRLMKGSDVCIHLASNADIAKAVSDPTIDFRQGTALTNYVLEAMRLADVKKIYYASGSGVYGSVGLTESKEDQGNLLPISTYGASKLAGEALIHSYCHMFGMTGYAFRFGNVVGARQTHGVGLDFTKQLLRNPEKLYILGDGNQTKSYVYINDIIDAVLLAGEKQTTKYEVYNVATKDYISVNEIANIIIDVLGLSNVRLEYSGGDRGWIGDLPQTRLCSDKIRSLGWTNKKNTKEAVRQSIIDMLPDIKDGKL